MHDTEEFFNGFFASRRRLHPAGPPARSSNEKEEFFNGFFAGPRSKHRYSPTRVWVEERI